MEYIQGPQLPRRSNFLHLRLVLHSRYPALPIMFLAPVITIIPNLRTNQRHHHLIVPHPLMASRYIRHLPILRSLTIMSWNSRHNLRAGKMNITKIIICRHFLMISTKIWSSQALHNLVLQALIRVVLGRMKAMRASRRRHRRRPSIRLPHRNKDHGRFLFPHRIQSLRSNNQVKLPLLPPLKPIGPKIPLLLN